VPGHIVVARCACKFERSLQPGASVEHLYVIAYTPDGRDLKTVESEKAVNIAFIKFTGSRNELSPCIDNLISRVRPAVVSAAGQQIHPRYGALACR